MLNSENGSIRVLKMPFFGLNKSCAHFAGSESGLLESENVFCVVLVKTFEKTSRLKMKKSGLEMFSLFW